MKYSKCAMGGISGTGKTKSDTIKKINKAVSEILRETEKLQRILLDEGKLSEHQMLKEYRKEFVQISRGLTLD